ncbi:MAG: hypothetical protein J6C08_00145 [Campylobacter sp.]|uniref:hypothetical protein n=1 Tax=Campylobacter sp. TaxID=205 RepID=UPI001AFEBB44|nr:hypothetical protein [Campylobacter sp.]MBO5062910.1 hypothetical protein [Campylobacter sp.]
MDIATISTLISTLGFPIVCVIGMGWFIYQIFIKTTKQQEQNMEKVQARCKEREDKLYNEIEKNRVVNEKAIETIAQYAGRLETIQNDISEIKTDITFIMSKQ